MTNRAAPVQARKDAVPAGATRRAQSASIGRAIRESTGQPIARDLRTELESRLGGGPATVQGAGYRALEADADRRAGQAAPRGRPADFGSVRLHSDDGARRAARGFGAQAFTIGNHIYADPARLAASTGRDMLAHELGHVLQQRALGRAMIQPRLIATGTDADIQRFIALAEPAMGERLAIDPTTHVITPVASLATPATSPAFSTAMHRIMDDPTQNAEAHFGQGQAGVAVGAFPQPSDMTGPTEQRIDMDDVEAIETGARGNGLGKLAHELTENYTAHAAAAVAGVDRFGAAHDAGLAAESDVAEATVGPGRRVADVDTPIVSNVFTRVQDFENYYLVFTFTRTGTNFVVSNAHRAPRVHVLNTTIDHFVTGSDAIPAIGPALIGAAAVAVAAQPRATVRIEGFADSTGTPAANARVSRRRAAAVSAALQAAGVDGGRIHEVGRSQASPVVPDDTEEHRAQNRRVVIMVDRPGP